MKESVLNRVISTVIMMLYVGTITPAQSWKELRQSVTVHMDSFYDKAAETKSREEWDNYVNTGFANIIQTSTTGIISTKP